MPERIRRTGDRLVLTLHPSEVETLRDLGRQLESLLAEPGSGAGVAPDPGRGQDPVMDRLFPRAYLDPTADEEEQEWQAAVHGDLVRQKTEALEALMGSLEVEPSADDTFVSVDLDLETAEHWAGALNDVRLALGVVLGVTEDDLEVAEGDPRVPGLELYHWLTWVQGALVEALLGGAEEIWRAAQDYG